MADFVRLTKKGIVSYEWDSETREYVPSRKGATNIPNLRLRCEIDEDVTLGDVFNAVQADPDLMEFIAQYSWCSAIEKFHAQARKPRKQDDDTPEEDRLIALELAPFAEFGKNHDKETKDATPEDFGGVFMHFSGVSASTPPHWSVSCTPTNELAHLPVRLLPNVQVNTNYKEERTAKYYASLLEVLDGIYWDISFHGGPEENEEFMEMLKERIDDIKSGEASTAPLDFGTIEE